MAYQRWCIRKTEKDLAAQISEDHEIDPFLALLLVSRGLTQDEQIDAFLHDDNELSDPYEIPGMAQAVKRIRHAVESFEKIAVYGDFDADGVTATVLLYSYLSHVKADVMYYIPDRETEGYGLNAEALERLADLGVQLVITVDNGISAVKEAEFLKEKSIDLIITDHHLPPDTLPQAAAIVDPHCQEEMLEFTDWSGVGVAFELVCALCGEEEAPFVRSLVDLVALGTVGDVVPLRGENRTLVRLGLAVMNDVHQVRPGIRALIEQSSKANKTLNAGDIAYALAPRINAAGRVLHAKKAAELLLCEDEDEAISMAQYICRLNTQRQELELQITEELEALLQKEPQRLYRRVLVFAGEDWHPGVLGIVAARMVERYAKPCVLLTYSSKEPSARGSARSVEGFSMYEAFCACEELLERFGGHTMAAGLSLDKNRIEEFDTKINEYAAKQYEYMPVPALTLDCKLSPAYISIELLDCLGSLEPFGECNPKPLFGLYHMLLEEVTPIGGGKHIRLRVSKKGTTLQVLRFGVTAEEFPYRAGDSIDLAVALERNEYQGRVLVSVQARAVRLSGLDEEQFFQQLAWYEAYLRAEPLTLEMKESLYPDRERCAQVYRFLLKEKGWDYAPEELYFRMQDTGLTLGQVMNSLTAFLELNLIRRKERAGFALCPPQGKVDLESAPILQKLKSI